MTYLIEQLINGICQGAIYALFAIGYTIIVGVVGLVSFTFGEVIMIGAFAALYLMQGYGLGVYLVGILPHGVFELTALILACTLGLLICRTGTDRLRRKKEAVPLWPRLQDCLRVFLFAVVPLLALAALVEAYVTPVLLALVM